MSTTPPGPRSLLTPAALHILMSLAQGDRHGYGIKQDVEERTGGALRLGPGTLYEAIHRMLRSGWIEETPGRPDDQSGSRKKVYRITSEGSEQMRTELARLEDIVRFAHEHALTS